MSAFRLFKEKPEQSHQSIPKLERVGQGTPANEDAFKTETAPPLDELSIPELFARRKAHEKILKDGWRDPTIDSTALESIAFELKKRRLDEDDYQDFLKNYRVSE